MRLFIRADGDGRMGTGHIMRCIALGQAWQERGGRVTFISRCGIEGLRRRILAEGFDLIPLPEAHPGPADLALTARIIDGSRGSRNNGAWLVTDGYHFTPEYQEAIRKEGIRLLVIDDMNHLPRYHADIVLNQNIEAERLDYSCDRDTVLLLGTRYVLLRREFLEYRAPARPIPDRAKNILVTFGGADPDNATLKVIEALMLLGDEGIKARIVVGPANRNLPVLRAAIAGARFEAELLVDPPAMPALMAWADMAISAGGTTCWELAFMGVPFLIIVLAENQSGNAGALAAASAAINCGRANEITTGKLACLLTDVASAKERRVLMSTGARRLSDGTGRVAVCAAMAG